MPELPDHYVSSTQAAAAVVLEYAPLLRQVPRLPTYTQPHVTWDIAPTCDPAFASAMRAVWAPLSLHDPAQFSEAEALLFRYQRMHGLPKLHRLRLDALHRHAPAAWHQREVALLSIVWAPSWATPCSPY